MNEGEHQIKPFFRNVLVQIVLVAINNVGSDFFIYAFLFVLIRNICPSCLLLSQLFPWYPRKKFKEHNNQLKRLKILRFRFRFYYSYALCTKIITSTVLQKLHQ